MAAPDAASIRASSKIDFAGLDYPEGDPDPLQEVVDVALSLFTRYSGQSWSDAGAYSNLAPAEGTEPWAKHAIRTVVEILAYQAQEDRLETFQDFDLIASFSAGGYNESRRSADDFFKLQGFIANMFRPMATQAARDDLDELFGDATKIPAFEVTEVAWGASPGLGLAGYGVYDTGSPGWSGGLAPWAY